MAYSYEFTRVTPLSANTPASSSKKPMSEPATRSHPFKAPGHILLFMTHASKIERMCVALSSNHPGPRIIPLYSSLPPHDQSLATKAFDTIVSTNVAEASVTIPVVGYVIDCGLKKEAGQNYRVSMSTLLTAAISQDSARQRAGRAGRTQAGVVYRLYTKEFHDSRMPAHTPPGIHTEEISGEVLRLKSLGLSNVTHFDWLDPPHPEAYLRAIGELEVLGYRLNGLGVGAMTNWRQRSGGSIVDVTKP